MTHGSLDTVVADIRAQLSDETVTIVGIDGFGGAGKSTVAARLVSQLGEGVVIAMDDFIVKGHMDDESWELGWDRQRLVAQILAPSRNSGSPFLQKFDWVTNSLDEPTDLPPSRLLIVEGISSLHPQLSGFYNYTIWIDTPIEEAKRRGEARDRGNENEGKWDLWARNDIRYLNDHRPDLHVDRVIRN